MEQIFIWELNCKFYRNNLFTLHHYSHISITHFLPSVKFKLDRYYFLIYSHAINHFYVPCPEI